MLICPKCHAESEDESRFCSECGTKLEKYIICPACGKELSHETKFCPNCGTQINAHGTGTGHVNGNVFGGDIGGSFNTMNTYNMYGTAHEDTVQCNVCGKLMPKSSGKVYKCHECGNYCCDEHFDSKYMVCAACAKKHREEARRKAEEEAKRRAEKEAKRRAEERRKRRAEERRKAEEETKRRAEEECKIEEEAQLKAARAARIKAAKAAIIQTESEIRYKEAQESCQRVEEERRRVKEIMRKSDEERRRTEEERRRTEEETRHKVEEERIAALLRQRELKIKKFVKISILLTFTVIIAVCICQGIIKNVKYQYILNNMNNNNYTTYEYLVDLKRTNYKDAADIYSGLYDWKIIIMSVNNDTESTQNKTFLSKYDPVYIHFKVVGGTPNEYSIKPYLKYTLPNGDTESYDWTTYSCYDGYKGWYGWTEGIYTNPEYGKTGTLTVKFYESKDAYESGDDPIGKVNINIVD